MKVAVWDTYVHRDNGQIMHFDVLVPTELKDAGRVYDFANQYLETKQFKAENVRSDKCLFCHIEEAGEEVSSSIDRKGYFIIELENCS